MSGSRSSSQAGVEGVGPLNWRLFWVFRHSRMYPAATATQFCVSETKRYVEIVYGFFRWAVSDEFLTAHGAEL